MMATHFERNVQMPPSATLVEVEEIAPERVTEEFVEKIVENDPAMVGLAIVASRYVEDPSPDDSDRDD
jgi:hypothetical protein